MVGMAEERPGEPILRQEHVHEDEVRLLVHSFTGVLSGAVWLSGGAANRLAQRNYSSAPSTLPHSPDEK